MLNINTSGSVSRTGDYGTSGTGETSGRNEKAGRAELEEIIKNVILLHLVLIWKKITKIFLV